MRIIVLAAAIAALAGCAHQMGEPMPIAQATDYQVCEAAVLGNPVPNGQQIVADEQRRRGLDCGPYAQAILADQAARRQAALQFMLANRPPQPVPMPMPQQTHCTSTRNGNTVNTNCY